MRLTIVILFACVLTCAAAIIPDSRRAQWQLGVNCGIPGGIPTNRTVYTNVPLGLTAAQINTVIQNCPTGQVVVLSNGTYTLTAGLTMKSFVTLRGQGISNTTLKADSGFTMINNDAGDSFSASGATVYTNTFVPGASNLSVSSGTGLSAGHMIQLAQRPTPATMWDIDGMQNYSCIQLVEIQSISGTNITIWPPLCYGLTTNQAPIVNVLGTPTSPYKWIGVEDLSLDANAKAVTYMYDFVGLKYSWLKNVETRKGANYHGRFYSALGCEVTGCFFNQAQDYGPNHSGLLLGNPSARLACNAIAFWDNISYRVAPALEVNDGTCGTICAYNFVWDSQIYETGGIGLAMNHGAEPINNLYEGNIVNMISSDGYFGGSYQDTIFRNWCTAYGPITYALNHHNIGIWLFSDTINANVVGNVMGYPSIVPEYAYGPCDTVLWDDGICASFGNGGDSGGARWGGDCDIRVTNTMIFFGNWESKYQGLQFSTNNCATTNFNETIPDSLYLSEKPAWFGNLTWPPFTSSNGYTNLTLAAIPAGYRFLYSTNPPAGDGTIAPPRRLRTVSARVGTIRAP